MPRSKLEVFYVVTRNGRRTSPVDYWTIDRAKEDADRLRATLKRYKDADASRVEIVRTADPKSII